MPNTPLSTSTYIAGTLRYLARPWMPLACFDLFRLFSPYWAGLDLAMVPLLILLYLVSTGAMHLHHMGIPVVP